MQILSVDQIRQWDQYTIAHEPIASVDLMERAAERCAQWISSRGWNDRTFHIFCGKGNNGGDGLAIARLLMQNGYHVVTYILEFGKTGSDDFQTSLVRLQQIDSSIHFIQTEATFPPLQQNDIIIDALYGSGLNKTLDGLSAALVHHINNAGNIILSIDLPSGLFADVSSAGNVVIEANYTLTFQCYKRGLLVQENARAVGEVQVLDIGLHPEFLAQITTSNQLLDERLIREIFKPRKRFSHKGTFGHALIAGGSYGKIGAAVLATKACLYAGAGLTTVLLPKCGYQVIQVAAPEAMALTGDDETLLTTLPAEIEKYDAIGIGPGMGTAAETQSFLAQIISRYQKPLVIDADGLNCLALQPALKKQLPPHSIVTPHPKEFDGLFGPHENDFERIATAEKQAADLKIIIVLKGHHTVIAMPDGNCYFNSTGNAGMAKGGSGDVLTGILTSLVAQGYAPNHAALLGVYIHGWAGDFAAQKFSREAMLPTQLIDCLSDVFLKLNERL